MAGRDTASRHELRALLKSAPAEMLRLAQVSKRVGSVKNNDASVSVPVMLAA